MEATVVQHFRVLEQELSKRFPLAIDGAKALAASIADPETASADDIWTRAWDKPLYANTRVATGHRWIAALKPYADGAWQNWGHDKGEIYFSKVGKGTSAAAFRAETARAEEVRAQTNIPMHRLFAIQGAATAVRERARWRNAPYADLSKTGLERLIPMIQSEMGRGWGHITVLHFLTDLGLACKPDLHLMRAARHLGIAPDLQPRQPPSLMDAIAINQCVQSLVRELDGTFTPRRLRYVDNVLMEISRQGLI